MVAPAKKNKPTNLNSYFQQLEARSQDLIAPFSGKNKKLVLICILELKINKNPHRLQRSQCACLVSLVGWIVSELKRQRRCSTRLFREVRTGASAHLLCAPVTQLQDTVAASSSESQVMPYVRLIDSL